MKTISRLTHALCLSTLLTALPLYANAADRVNSREFFGLLPIRDMTPFGFVRLDMRQSHATFAASERPSVEVDFGYQNTWALSNDVERYLKSRPRSPLTQADIANIRALPGEHFLLDSEIALDALDLPARDHAVFIEDPKTGDERELDMRATVERAA